MRIVEGIEALSADARPEIGEHRPASADIDPAQHETPQHRRRVAERQYERRLGAEDRPVVECKHFVDFTEFQMVESGVPPVVDGEQTVPAPEFGVVAHPGKALLQSPLHLHDMRDCVLRPAVAGMERRGAPSLALGEGVVATLLEAKGMHGGQKMIARPVFAPRRQGARDAVPHHARITHEEIDVMADLQRQQIARMVDRHPLQRCRRVMKVAGRELAQGLEMGPLPRGHRQSHGPVVALPGTLESLWLGADQVHPAVRDVGHGEVRGRGDRAVHRLQRVAEVAVLQIERALEKVARLRRGARQFEALAIMNRHGIAPLNA